VNSSALPRNSNYIAGDILEVMTLFWRVKKWKMSVSGSLSQPGAIWSFNGIQHELLTTSSVEKEEDLVCFNSEDKFYTAFRTAAVLWGTLNDEPFANFADLTVGLGHLFAPYNTFESNAIVKNGDVYKLPFFCGLQGVPLLSDPLDLGWVPVGTYTLNVLGISATPKTLYGPDGYSGSATAVVSAKEYWSYGGTYDTATGNPL
jgi:hypothetical protein